MTVAFKPQFIGSKLFRPDLILPKELKIIAKKNAKSAQ
jgi:hypothetical protein